MGIIQYINNNKISCSSGSIAIIITILQATFMLFNIHCEWTVLYIVSNGSHNSSGSFSTANPDSVPDSVHCASLQSCDQRQAERAVCDPSRVLYLADITALGIFISEQEADRFDISEAQNRPLHFIWDADLQHQSSLNNVKHERDQLLQTWAELSAQYVSCPAQMHLFSCRNYRLFSPCWKKKCCHRLWCGEVSNLYSDDWRQRYSFKTEKNKNSPMEVGYSSLKIAVSV